MTKLAEWRRKLFPRYDQEQDPVYQEMYRARKEAVEKALTSRRELRANRVESAYLRTRVMAREGLHGNGS